MGSLSPVTVEAFKFVEGTIFVNFPFFLKGSWGFYGEFVYILV